MLGVRLRLGVWLQAGTGAQDAMAEAYAKAPARTLEPEQDAIEEPAGGIREPAVPGARAA